MAEQSRLFAWREAIRDHDTLSANARLVALTLSLRMKSTTGDCAVGYPRLVKETNLSLSSVRRATDELHEARLLMMKKPPKNAGRGVATEYTLSLEGRVSLGSPSQGKASEGRASDRRVSADAQSDPSKGVTEDTELEAQEITPNSKVKRSRRSASTDVPDFITGLCSTLASAIEERTGKRPKVTEAWKHDMDLLVRRGPAHWEQPEAIDPERVRTAIDLTFKHLGIPKANGFCWADQVQSPGALRKHWDTLRREVKNASGFRAVLTGKTLDDEADDMARILGTGTAPAITAGGRS